jgi:hypothetical protein
MPRFEPAAGPRAAALALTLLSGCTAFERGAEQGDPAVHAVTGCPDLSGTFALDGLDGNGEPDPAFDPSKRAAVDAALFTPKSEHSEGPGPLARYGSVVIEHDGTHALRLRFIVPSTTVLEALNRIREHERPRYAEWYALMQPPTREAFVARHGEAARAQRLRELGPDTGVSVTLERNRDYTCENGWVLLPREHRQPVRMTLDEAGHVVFESKEWTTVDTVGWGGQSLELPTGAYLGTARWPRNPAAREWAADEAANGYVFARPADVVEVEQASFADNSRRHALRLYATPDEVRTALTPLVPEGVAIVGIEITELPFKGPRVRVHAMPADASMDSEDQRKRLEWFLAALREGDPGHIEDSEVVKRVISSGGRHRHEYEIFLDTHPAVQPATKLSGFADLDVLRERLAAYAASGCVFDAVRYAGSGVTLGGRGDRAQCVSDSLRALDAASPGGGRRVELIEMRADASGGYTFEIRVPESPLTKA